MRTRLMRDSVKLTRSCWQRMTCMSAAAMCSFASVALEASLSGRSSSEMLTPPIGDCLQPSHQVQDTLSWEVLGFTTSRLSQWRL